MGPGFIDGGAPPKAGPFLMTRWWFQILYFLFSPVFGKVFQFDLRIFFRWVGSTTNQMSCFYLSAQDS